MSIGKPTLAELNGHVHGCNCTDCRVPGHTAYEAPMREFDTGATRNVDENKPDYEGFLSPLVLARYAEYMNKNRVQADGKVRASDNWQKGIPLDAYMKSGFRHFMEWWREHRRGQVVGCDVTEEALCAEMFNVMGYLHELLKARAVMAETNDRRRI